MSIILCVDEAQSRLEMMCELLEQFGYQVLLAETGEEVLWLAQHHRPQLIVLDLDIDGSNLDGRATFEHLRGDADLFNVPLLVIGDADDRADMRTLGAVEYIERPLPLSVMLSLARKYLQ